MSEIYFKIPANNTSNKNEIVRIMIIVEAGGYVYHTKDLFKISILFARVMEQIGKFRFGDFYFLSSKK